MHLFYGRIEDNLLDKFYQESGRFGTTLQVPQRLWPTDRAAFAEYWDAMLDKVSYDDEVRTYLLDQVVGLGPYRRYEQLLFRR